MNRRHRLTLSLVTLLLLPGAGLRAEPQPAGSSQKPPQAASGQPAAAQPSSVAPLPAPPQNAAASQPADIFSQLKVLIPKDQLPPLRSVRPRDTQEATDRSRKGAIRLRLQTQPKGARVLYGGKLLGDTPLTLTAPRGSTPLDVTIRRPGYMTLRTRIMRKKSNTYFFKLTPAKFHEPTPAQGDQ